MYVAHLDDLELGRGDIREITACIADTATRLLRFDHDMDVAMLNEAFSSGAVAEAVDIYGAWQTTLRVRGKAFTLRVEPVTMST